MINIKYIWNEKLAIKAAQDIYEYELKKSNKRYIGWFFVALTQFAIVGALKHDAFGLLFVSTFLMIYWYILRWPIRKYFIKRTFIKSPFANKTITLQIKKDGIYKEELSQVSKNNIKDIIKLEDGIIIYYNGGNLYFPNEAFKDKRDIQKSISLLKGKNNAKT